MDVTIFIYPLEWDLDDRWMCMGCDASTDYICEWDSGWFDECIRALIDECTDYIWAVM